MDSGAEIRALRASLSNALAALPRRALVTQANPVRVQLLSSQYDSAVWWAPSGLNVGDEVMVANVEGGLAVLSAARNAYVTGSSGSVPVQPSTSTTTTTTTVPVVTTTTTTSQPVVVMPNATNVASFPSSATVVFT